MTKKNRFAERMEKINAKEKVEVAKVERTIVAPTVPVKKVAQSAYKQKKRYNFSLRPEEHQALKELAEMLGEKSSSDLLGKMIMKYKKMADEPGFNKHQTDIFDFL